MQNLKKNWLVVWKVTWGIWKVFTRALKVSKLGLWWDPLIQNRKRMSLRSTEELCVMTMKKNAKLEEELTCHFKIVMRNLNEFWSKHLKISKSFILMCSFWAKYILFEVKKYRGVIFHETDEVYKIWRGIDLSF